MDDKSKENISFDFEKTLVPIWTTYYTLAWPQIINWDLLILQLNKQYWGFIEMGTKKAFGSLWVLKVEPLGNQIYFVVFMCTTFGTSFIFIKKIKCWKMFFWHLLCRDSTMSSKIMKLGLSKSIFYVQNYQNLSNLLLWITSI